MNVCILTQYAGSKICAHSPISFKMAVLHGYMYGSIKVTSVRSQVDTFELSHYVSGFNNSI